MLAQKPKHQPRTTWFRSPQQTGPEMMRRIRTLLALARPDVDPEVASALRALDLCTTSREERAGALQHAVTIAQMGGVDDDTLQALLYLAASRRITPGVAAMLQRVGIDPWS